MDWCEKVLEFDPCLLEVIDIAFNQTTDQLSTEQRTIQIEVLIFYNHVVRSEVAGVKCVSLVHKCFNRVFLSQQSMRDQHVVYRALKLSWFILKSCQWQAIFPAIKTQSDLSSIILSETEAVVTNVPLLLRTASCFAGALPETDSCAPVAAYPFLRYLFLVVLQCWQFSEV